MKLLAVREQLSHARICIRMGDYGPAVASHVVPSSSDEGFDWSS